MNRRGILYREERLRVFVLANRAKPARAVLDGLIAEIRAFTGTAPQSDDITLVVVAVE